MVKQPKTKTVKTPMIKPKVENVSNTNKGLEKAVKQIYGKK